MTRSKRRTLFIHGYKKMHGADLHENDKFKKTVNASLQISAWADLNKNGKFNVTKLVMHGYKLLNAILTEMKT